MCGDGFGTRCAFCCFFAQTKPGFYLTLGTAPRAVSSQRAESPQQGEGDVGELAGLKREGAFQRASALRVI